MKTQISRDSRRSDQAYSGVYQQQGRMLTDADWNELTGVSKRRLVQALLDAIKSGVPKEGGLRITAGPNWQIQPGHLYADGVPGHLPGSDPIDYDDQDDFPAAPTLPTDSDYTVYADLWERSVIALEDANLNDPALHGADTCTRSQTMVQIKWCPSAVDPENADANPKRGDATVSLVLRNTRTGQDPCDPCATENILGQERVGNYLFRIEAHDIRDVDGVTRLTLKWSQENGAEQHLKDNLPADFLGDQWIYEFYSTTSEKHLGQQLSSDPDFVVRGSLQEQWPEDLDDFSQYPYVRRWDGYCVLENDGGTWSLASEAGDDGDQWLGIDRGIRFTDSGADTDDGFFTVGAAFEVNLQTLTMTVDLAGNIFLAGDYWYGLVREDVDQPGDDIASQILPTGIVHHYLRLARVAFVDDTATVLAPEDAERRRLNFPPLSELWASDVGFINNCINLYADAENVQQALDALCDIDASDIHYDVPDCPSGEETNPTVQSLLREALVNWPDLDEDERISVKDMLDAFLCEMDADHIPFPSTCDHDLYPDGTRSVGDALRAICEIQARHVGYEHRDDAVVVDTPDDLETVEQAIDYLLRQSGGGGLAAIIRALTNAVSISGETEAEDEGDVKPDRQLGIETLPVTGIDSLSEATIGMGLNIVRFLYTLGLEWLDVGEVPDVAPVPDLGHSGALSLSALVGNEGFLALWQRFDEKSTEAEAFFEDEEYMTLALFVGATVIGRRLLGDNPGDPLQTLLDVITDLEADFGTVDTWNGQLLRQILLEGFYVPLFGTDFLDHPIMSDIKDLLMEMIAEYWRCLSQRFLLETREPCEMPPEEDWLDQVMALFEALGKALRGDGLVLDLSQEGVDFININDLLMQPPSDELPGASWLLAERRIIGSPSIQVISRLNHSGVFNAFAEGRPEAPRPDLILAPNNQFRIADAQVSDRTLSLVMDPLPGGDDFPQHIWHIRLSAIQGFRGNLTMVWDADNVLDLFDDSGNHVARLSGNEFIGLQFQGQGDSMLTAGSMGPFPPWVRVSMEDGILRLTGGTESESIRGTVDVGARNLNRLLSFSGLSANGPGQESHALLIADFDDGQLVLVLQGELANSGPVSPWWQGERFTLHAALHLPPEGAYRFLGGGHDQLIVNSSSNDGWLFLPFRALIPELWRDPNEFAGLVQTIIRDGDPIPQLDGITGDFTDGQVADLSAAGDPHLSIARTHSSGREFFRCFVESYPLRDMLLPSGVAEDYAGQTKHQLELLGNETTLISLRNGSESDAQIEYHTVVTAIGAG